MTAPGLMRRLLGGSIGRKATLLPTAVATITFVVLIALQALDRIGDTYALAESNEEGTTQLLAAQIAGAVRWSKADVVTATFAPIVAQPGNNLASLLVLDAAGKELVRYDSKDLAAFDLGSATADHGGDIASKQTVRIRADQHFVEVLPVVNEKDQALVGTLAVAWSRQRLQADAVGAVWQAIAMSVAGLIAIILVQSMAMRRLVVAPVRGLTSAMKRLADQDTSVAVPGTDRIDELGTMAAALQVFKDSALENRRLVAEQARQEEEQKRRMEEQRLQLESSLAGELGVIVDAAMVGDFSRQIDLDGKTGFIRKLAEDMNQLVDTVSTVLGEVVAMMSAMANGDLSRRIAGDYQGELLQLKIDANTTAGKLAQIVGKTVEGMAAIKAATTELSGGAADLSARTEEQVASLEEVTATIRQLNGTVQRGAENADQARQLASAARSAAEAGGQVASAAVGAMGGIEQSSRRISDIVGMIDEIAFQTNLLALNAAVEAARAGETGRGFAVVAGEVRALAQRASQASQEIKSLITNSNAQVKQGVELVNKAGATLGEIVTSVKRVSDIVAEIAAANKEQSASVGEVQEAIGQIEQATQQNAALVEETTAALGSADNQVQTVTDVIAFFQSDAVATAQPANASAKARGRQVRARRLAATGTDGD